MSPAQLRPLVLALALALAAAAAAAAAASDATAASPARTPRLRRQLADDDALQPLDDAASSDGDAAAGREKRKFEGAAQATFGVKNAVLGLVFGKINSIIDAKTRLVETLDRTNIEKNRALGIEAPRNDGLASLGGLIGQIVGPKLQLIGPKLQAVSGLLGGLSGGSGGSGAGGSGGGGGGSGLGSILSLVTSLSGSSSGGAGAGATVETIDSSEEDEDSS